MKFIALIGVLLCLCSCGGAYFSANVTYEEKSRVDDAIMAGFGIMDHNIELEEVTFFHEIEAGMLYYEGDETCYFIGRYGLFASIYKDLELITSIGPAFLYNGGQIEGLAQSFVYSNCLVGLRWNKWELAYEHISSPFHDGYDGDIGLNFIKLRKWF